MKEIVLNGQEGTDQRLIKDISQLHQISVGEGAAVCKACGERLREGGALTALAFRPADTPVFRIAHAKCRTCRHEPTEHFTRGVRELVVGGRVGTCQDARTQSSWPVLLDPQLRVVSPADTTDIHPLSESEWWRRPIAESAYFTAADSAPSRHPWERAIVRASSDVNPAADGSSSTSHTLQTPPATDARPAHARSNDRLGGAR